ncbi:MAG: redox-regulated ATPase YchF [Candidatus Magasanikbacteria bacterium RIFCSPLOWO2_01_FULL_43_20b]|uniref:Ribosome-binding ATPase YchF n=1 Tax=Candidatus Magasanikbacteria bacterium RIFCSPLOWO2_12_FULL_43_12 TaxID=1798692 RepID=A0A1F6MVI2_9BACT|nr:MAG: redox-regulated ATPase YchF [Candidatus Magasanikbacteria bacterium RIFCSPLOWO2_02_FULL_43_22]OGH72128.1 MAG: redox-regulated ATPase YchF [Candidatus Magasanikbacteria bacterium RIFCSPHIGHO2_02_FULL_44_13]OGH72914.1 MAG: redox-regulated ATPase YchF [Candidatus Magasanikbacteria bacterium RIFCSPLOWO2_01_FULL_43_20b]OGH75654.1 MAG: redox-regulated ATPase YchF [Candidatus Magasanikbacteria bacterium RIFCSPLOWO2_12_FULL_43_12]
MLSIGIVGLPNVGKSTLFNALTRSKQADAQNYPFCTIEPNVGVVEVPDERLAQLAEVSKSKKVIPTAIQFVDIAGLVKGASEGAGLGNKFLSHIREVDAIVQVVRAFSDSNVVHVQNRVDPKEDAEIINLELILADLQTIGKKLDTTKKGAKGKVDDKIKAEIEVLEKVLDSLQVGKFASAQVYSDDEVAIVRDLHLLTMKPVLYVVNVDESQKSIKSLKSVKSDELNFGDAVEHIEISAKVEAEVAELSPEEARQYLKELGIEKTGLDKLILAGYKLLDLVTFLTSGEPETRAWTVKRGTKGPEAAGVIHTDFIKGYIKADVCDWQDFVQFGGWSGIKTSGKLRLEGKEYEVRDGDVCYFHIAT